MKLPQSAFVAALLSLVTLARASVSSTNEIKVTSAPTPPFPSVIAAAKAAGIPWQGIDPPLATNTLNPGDSVTALLTLRQRKRSPLQWLVCPGASCGPTLLKQPLPTAGQLFRGCRIFCGIMPKQRQELNYLWEGLLHGTPPTDIKEIKEKLRQRLPAPDKDQSNVQHIDILRDAKKFNYDLSKRAELKAAYLPPAGIFLLNDDQTF
jgi:hypothetical protein